MRTRHVRPALALPHYAAGLALAAASLLAAPSTARAQATLNNDSLHTETDVYYYDSGFFYHGPGWHHSDSPVQGTNWSNTEFSSYSNTGLSGTATSRNTSGYSPASPGVGGTFSAINVALSVDSEITSSDLTGNHYFEDAYGKSWSNLTFTVAQPTIWSWEADVMGTCSTNGWDNSAVYRFLMYDSTNTVTYAESRRTTVNGAADFNEHISLGGLIPAGSYNVYIFAQANNTNYQDVGGGTGTAHVSVNGTLSVPAPGAPLALAAAGLLMTRRRRR